MQEYECTHSGDEHGHARTHILYIQVNAYKRANILCYTSQKYFLHVQRRTGASERRRREGSKQVAGKLEGNGKAATKCVCACVCVHVYVCMPRSGVKEVHLLRDHVRDPVVIHPLIGLQHVQNSFTGTRMQKVRRAPSMHGARTANTGASCKNDTGESGERNCRHTTERERRGKRG